ncbi:hypothetical protein NDU88_007099 [Pleurodeles waltl]|uniref:Uncharacterized protein n=1 Tax=Pleurodeles waltl TaxID=8319 RepID=A0AAV7RP47_PLEWA|nr:hypothetical protein NDU88_007099 [Pleurodeles waltl]
MTTQRVYEHREKYGSLLYRLVIRDIATSFVPAVKDAAGMVVSTAPNIAEAFAAYHQRLYVHNPRPLIKTTHPLLSDISLPLLTPIQRKALEKPGTEDKIHAAISNLKSG